MKKTLSAILVASTVSLFAGEPILLKSDPDATQPKTRVSLLERKMQANSEGQANAVIKMNLSQLVFTNLSFQGEYGFHKNMSGALGFSFLLPRALPGFFADEDPTGEGLRNTKFTGWAVTPEFRFYPGQKIEHQAPHGFYLAPYFRYAKYKLTSSYYDFYNGKEYGYDMELVYKGYTAGLMIGSQWLIGDHFSIDWWILGAGAGKASLSMAAIGKGVILNSAEQAELRREMEEEFAGVSVFGTEPVVETTSNSAKVTMPGLPMISYRGFGLCIGYAF